MEAVTGRIGILPPEEARRIAAGEVIDRPAALIREFIDNAIDSGALNIDVSIDEGGIKKAEVADDGSGMGREDLAMCWLAHATSKIRTLDDLLTSVTLGFRGEALAAAAAVARLEIISAAENSVPGTGATRSGTPIPGEAWRLEVGPGERNPPRITSAGRTRGTTVRALNLFDTIPARKQFLKREGSESALCRQVFIEKALAFPRIAFRLTQDGRPKVFLPAAQSKKDRFAASLLNTHESDYLHEIHVSGDGFSADVVIGGPELFRSDRRLLYVFANGRRIQDYSLMQAMEYGTQGWFPNGVHPIGAVYITVNPVLADFNIHPAKREARFRDQGAIHHALSVNLRDFCHHSNVQKAMQTGQKTWERESDYGLLVAEALSNTVPAHGPATYDKAVTYNADKIGGMDFAVITSEDAPAYGEIRYVGRAFGLFIIIERGDKLFLIDQHAAHERILYNRFLAGIIPRQELLVPIAFTADSAEADNFLEAKREELAKLAIEIERDGNGWRIDALPAGWRMSDAETARAILELQKAGENIAERWAATLCCHQAVRDGDCIDEAAALALAEEAFALPDPRCPHGRPVWTDISREALCKAVRRIR